MSRKRILIGLVVVVCGVALFALVKLAHRPAASEESGAETPTVVTVQTGRLTRATLHGYVEGFGAGVVAEARVVEGQRVEKGAELFELDPRAAKVAVQRAQDAVTHAQQIVTLQKDLIAGQNTSVRNLQDAQAQLATAQADLAAAETQLAYLHVTAPLAGTVTRVNVKPGEAVDLTTPLAEIVDLARLVVAASIPAAQAGALKAGQSVELQTEPPLSASLSFVSPAVEATNDTVLVRAALPAGSAVRPGQFVRLRVVTATHTDCLAAPAESVVTDAEGQSVIAVVKSDEAEQAPVKTGLREGGLVEIEAPGLKEGQTVVTVGAYGLPKKTKIRVVSP